MKAIDKSSTESALKNNVRQSQPKKEEKWKDGEDIVKPSALDKGDEKSVKSGTVTTVNVFNSNEYHQEKLFVRIESRNS